MTTPCLRLEHLNVCFETGSGGLLRRRTGIFTALRDVSFSLEKGECLGLIGESGSGKSTLGRTVAQLIPAYEGKVVFNGIELSVLNSRSLLPYRQKLQMVFQDPTESLNPRFTVEEIVCEPLRLLGIGSASERHERASDMLEQVGLSPSMLRDRPGQYSGGQRQRIAIARALVTEPELLVLDEPTSGLDVSMQARILNLLKDLQKRLGLTFLFITHDLGAVAYLARRIAVLYHGELVECAFTEDLIRRPRHPYTRALLDALPRFVRETKSTGSNPPLAHREPGTAHEIGSIPAASHFDGCPYFGLCPRRQDRCFHERPAFSVVNESTGVACHYPLEPAA